MKFARCLMAAVRMAAVLSVAAGCGQQRDPVMPATPVRTPTPKQPAATPAPQRSTRTSPTPAAASPTVPRAADAQATPAMTPAQSLTPKPPASPGSEDAVLKARIEAWRAAWQRKDLAVYIGFYAPTFSGDGKDLAAWRAHKSRVFERVGAIRVETSNLRVDVQADRATVKFTQLYSAGGPPDRGLKTLQLERSPGGWFIVSETFSKGR